ncbi:hypothetical protein [Dokdonella sp.]|uniref:hypothetical protein n=1 Tax=Dokdonella sp. TaxID=2291710 RepID=UPI0025B7C183|nr:hypothetical protein [Dokdonella sp.]MBX3689638.1 hypothetical protein [Dokdonella sp.]
MQIESTNVSPALRETLERYLPYVAAIAIAWLLARGLKKSIWSAIGLYWAWRFMPW